MEEKLPFVEIFCDGACSGNPGPGGWGTILRYEGHEKELSGFMPDTTNNQMELTAVIMGLKALKKKCEVRIVTDSQYVWGGLEKGWAKSWQRNNWMKSDKTPAKNKELWSELLSLVSYHRVHVEWVRGHNGHPENERCDALAVKAYSHLRT